MTKIICNINNIWLTWFWSLYLEPQSTKKPFDLTKFLDDQKSNLEELYIVQLAKNLINFKTSKLEELKDFLEYKAHRWENIISNEKSKIEDFLSNNDYETCTVGDLDETNIDLDATVDAALNNETLTDFKYKASSTATPVKTTV